MKVSASPFEAPVSGDLSKAKSASKIQREKREASLHLVRSPSSSASVREGLDSATREALKELAHRLSDDGAENDTSEQKDREPQQPIDDQASAEEKIAEAKEMSEIPDGLARLTTDPKLQSAMARLQERLALVRRERGREVYRQVLRDEAMLMIEDQLRDNLSQQTRDVDGEDEDLDALGLLLNLGADFIDAESGSQQASGARALKRVA